MGQFGEMMQNCYFTTKLGPKTLVLWGKTDEEGYKSDADSGKQRVDVCKE